MIQSKHQRTLIILAAAFSFLTTNMAGASEPTDQMNTFISAMKAGDERQIAALIPSYRDDAYARTVIRRIQVNGRFTNQSYVHTGEANDAIPCAAIAIADTRGIENVLELWMDKGSLAITRITVRKTGRFGIDSDHTLLGLHQTPYRICETRNFAHLR